MDERSIFLAALERETDDERNRFLDEACGDDAELRRRVESLLRACREGAGFLEKPLIEFPLPGEAVPMGAHDQPTLPSHGGTGSPDESQPAGGQPPRSTVRYFGDYELLEEIARGGMGVVYKARQKTLGRIVALKMILSGQLAGEAEVKRFYAEARAAARLNHPNIVPIFEIGRHEGQHYFSMALVNGESLARKIVTGPLPPPEAARLMKKVAEAVAYAHIEGVLHRDLKPANVLIDSDGEPRVTDFGLAKRIATESLTPRAIEAAEGLTATGQILGTPGYMPPEQASGKTDEIGPPADVYALGAMLYCLLTGRPPFQAASPLDTLLQVLDKEPVPPRQFNPKIPRDLETIALTCLQKDPRRRYQTAQGLADDLGRFLDGRPVTARPVGKLNRAVRWCRRHPTTAGLSAALLLVLFAASVAGFVMAARQAAFRKVAEQREQQSRSLLYAAQINLAGQAWEDGEVDRMREILDAQRPQQGRPDLRDWEWYYLRSLGQNSFFTVEEVTAFALSRDGRRLAVSMWRDPANAPDVDEVNPKPVAVIYELPSRKPMVTLRGHSKGIWSIAWSPAGHRLATGSHDKTVRIWDTTTGQLIASLEGHAGGVLALAWDPTGQRLASAGDDGTIVVWDVADRSEAARLPHGDPGSPRITSLAWRPDGKQLISVNLDHVKTWDASTWNEASADALPQAVTRSSHVYAADWSPDARQLALCGLRDFEPATILWDRGTNQPRTLFGHQREVLCVAWNSDGTKLVTGSWDKTVRIWDARTGRQLIVIRGHRRPVEQVAWTVDGRRVIARGGDLKIWDASRPPEAVMFDPEPRLTGARCDMSWDPSGTLLGVAVQGGDVGVFDTTGTERRRLSEASAPIRWSPDGRYIATGAKSDGARKGIMAIYIWDAASHEIVHKLRGHRGSIHNLCWSPDGARLASSSLGWRYMRDEKEVFNVDSDRVIRIWDVRSGKEVASIDAGPDDYVGFLAWSPSGDEIAWGRNERVGVLGVSAGHTVREYSTGAGLSALAWDPSGRRIAAGFWSQPVLAVFDAATGHRQLECHGHTAQLTSVAWHPAGRRIASAGDDGRILIWDVSTGRQLLALEPTTSSRPFAGPVCWSPDGRRLAAWQDEVVKIFDAHAAYAASD